MNRCCFRTIITWIVFCAVSLCELLHDLSAYYRVNLVKVGITYNYMKSPVCVVDAQHTIP